MAVAGYGSSSYALAAAIIWQQQLCCGSSYNYAVWQKQVCFWQLCYAMAAMTSYINIIVIEKITFL
jgi:hypothetical protein